ncbi:MAG: hypothetical protein ABIQ18_49380 [Umezawaea sp.]
MRKVRSRKRKVVIAAGVAATLAVFGGLAAVSFAGPKPAPSTGFADDFEDGDTAGWSKSGGSWSVESDGSKVLRQTKTGATLARQFAGQTDWSDYTASARVKPLSVAADGYAAIVARSAGATSFYRLALTGSNEVRLESVKSGTASVLGEAPLTVGAGTSYTLGLSVTGTTLSGSVNGATVVTGTASAFAQGRIGVQTFDATAEFDDVTVTAGATSTPPATTSPLTSAGSTTVSPGKSASPSTPPSPEAPPAPSPTGFESSPIGFGADTAGGAGGPTLAITSVKQLVEEAASDGPKVLQLSTVLTGSGTDQVVVSSDKTIVGVTANAGLTGVGILVKKAHNVVIRNLKVSFARAPVDLIAVQASQHVWIDHNELFNDTSHDKDFYDGMVDLTHAADFVTVSWNYLHDHHKGSLVGHSDDNKAEDAGHLRITYSHNWFDNVGARLPRVRFGTVHLYDNLFTNAGTSGIHCLMDAQRLVQNNVFVNVKLPVWTTEDSERDGFALATGNDYGGQQPVITQTGTFTKAPYPVVLDQTAAVAALVKAGAGTGRT